MRCVVSCLPDFSAVPGGSLLSETPFSDFFSSLFYFFTSRTISWNQFPNEVPIPTPLFVLDWDYMSGVSDNSIAEFLSSPTCNLTPSPSPCSLSRRSVTYLM